VLVQMRLSQMRPAWQLCPARQQDWFSPPQAQVPPAHVAPRLQTLPGQQLQPTRPQSRMQREVTGSHRLVPLQTLCWQHGCPSWPHSQTLAALQANPVAHEVPLQQG
jgi:hypothetical protein